MHLNFWNLNKIWICRTATLHQGSGPVPAGNGVSNKSLIAFKKIEINIKFFQSEPHLTKIQICCPGFKRNVHIYRRCDPVCSQGCGNGVCVAPDQCECLRNTVKNLAGGCVASCPFG